MNRLLLVDNDSAFREMLAADLNGYGFEVAQSASASQALNVLTEYHPQAVITDIDLPAIDGFEFIRYVRSRGIYRGVPIIILSAICKQAHIVEAAKLGIRDYLLKSSFSLADLLQRLQAHVSVPISTAPVAPPSGFSASPSPSEPPRPSPSPAAVFTHGGAPALEHISLEDFLRRTSTCVLKPQAIQTLALCNDPEVTIGALENEVKTAPSLVMKVLQMANSAAFNRGGPVTSLKNAISALGLSNLRNIISSVIVQEGILNNLVEEDAWHAWQASLACASLMDALKDPEIGPYAGSGYIIGICIDIVPMLLSQFLGPGYQRVRSWCSSGYRTPFDAVEAIFGGSISDVYWQTLIHFGLPDSLARPICEYAAYITGALTSTPSHTVAALDAIAQESRAMGFSMVPTMPIRPFTRSELRAIPALKELPFQLKRIREEVMSRSFEYTRDSKAMRRILEKPFFAFRDAQRLAFCHDAWVAEDGPILHFLSNLAETTHLEVAQLAADPSPFNGLVIVSDAPGLLFPTGIPGNLSTLVLHRGPLGNDELPRGSAISQLTIPCPQTELARAVHNL